MNTSYVDPISGVSFKRIAAKHDRAAADRTAIIRQQSIPSTGCWMCQSTWTNAQNAMNTSTSGSFASYSGTTRSPLFLPLGPNTPGSTPWDVTGNTLEDVRINIYGFATATGNAEDSKVLLCLGTNYNTATDTCTSEIEAVLPSSPNKVQSPAAYPTFQFTGWQLGRPLTAGEASVPTGNATVSNSVVTLSSGYLPPATTVGAAININGTWYTIGKLGTAQSFTLAETGVNVSGVWSLGYLRSARPQKNSHELTRSMWLRLIALLTAPNPTDAGEWRSRFLPHL